MSPYEADTVTLSSALRQAAIVQLEQEACCGRQYGGEAGAKHDCDELVADAQASPTHLKATPSYYQHYSLVGMAHNELTLQRFCRTRIASCNLGCCQEQGSGRVHGLIIRER